MQSLEQKHVEIIFRMHIRSKNEKKEAAHLQRDCWPLVPSHLQPYHGSASIRHVAELNEIQSIGVEAQKIGS